jgi:AmmeMemoRadiSam system protein B/AmmeMemoRadiSam system protein A
MRLPRSIIPVSLAITLFSLLAPPPIRAADAKVRPAACAGDWYPADPAALTKLVDDLLAAAPKGDVSGRPLAVISPHAGYRFSAPVACAGYACLRGQSYRRVIVLAFSHRNAGRYHGIDVPKELTAYATPLGDVPIDRDVCDALLKNRLFSSDPAVDAGEHSLELQLPYLQRAIGKFALVPLLIGQMRETDYTAAAQALLPFLDEGTLLVASSDFTHFGPNYGYQPFKEDVPDKLRELSNEAATALRRCDFDGFAEHLAKTHDTICGRGPILLLLRLLAMHGGADGVCTACDTSGHQTGDWTNSVTYQSLVFTPRKGTLGEKERSELLRLARQTVTATVNKEQPPNVDTAELPAAVRANGSCFVTLQNHGELRGCIGNMVADGPLYQSVIRNAALACHDSRFRYNPVTPSELDQLDIEISYLTPVQRAASPDDLVVGRNGIMIALDGRRGVLLPQVAYERGWTRAEFLKEVCYKAGLPADSWKKPEAELYLFEAEVFGERK